VKLPAYPRTKPSGVEWLGDVPGHWAVKRLKYSASINDEALPETTSPDFEFEYVDIGGVSAVDGITATEQVVFENAPSRARRKVRHGDTIVSTVRTYLRAIAPIKNPPENLIVSTGFAVVRPRKVESSFLAYALRESSFVESVVARSVGVSYPAVNASEVGGIAIPLPDHAEQQAIAAFLDRETGRVDRLVAKKRELIERLKEKRTALISRTVTRGLPPAAARATGLPANPPLKPSGLDWLRDIPKHWDVKKLSWLFRYAKGPSAAMLTKEYVADNVGDYPVFSGQTENEGLMGMIDWHEFNFATPVIFVTTVGARAMSTRIVSGKFSLSQNCALIIPRRETFDPRYYEAVLRCLFDYERRSISLIMQPSLRFDDLDRFRVPLPPPQEQSAIAAYLDTETAKLDALAAKVQTAVERLQEYRTALITAAVTGKIDVRNTVRTGMKGASDEN
jgi:type I restriction enzyme S subunit